MGVLKNEQGEIAVLVSPGYGAGWYSWNTSCRDCLFNAEIAQLVLDGKMDAAETRAEELWPDGYWGGASDLRVHWLGPGTLFRIDEYDGSEGLVEADDQEWVVTPSSSEASA